MANLPDVLASLLIPPQVKQWARKLSQYASVPRAFHGARVLRRDKVRHTAEPLVTAVCVGAWDGVCRGMGIVCVGAWGLCV